MSSGVGIRSSLLPECSRNTLGKPDAHLAPGHDVTEGVQMIRRIAQTIANSVREIKREMSAAEIERIVWPPPGGR